MCVVLFSCAIVGVASVRLFPVWRLRFELSSFVRNIEEEAETLSDALVYAFRNVFEC